MSGKRPHREPGIRRDGGGRIHAHVRAGGQLRFKRFPVDTPLETVRRWRLDTRASLRSTQRLTGTLAADVELGPFSTSTVWRAFVRAAARIGIRGAPTTSATATAPRCIESRGDTRLVKDVLGHSDTRTTERYTLGHVPEAMRLATSRFEDLGTSSAPEAAAHS